MAKKNRATDKKQRNAGPYLATAVFCDKIVRSDDGTMSAIRIVDRTTLTIPSDAPKDTPSETNRLLLELEGLIAFKTGGASGTHSLKLRLVTPSGACADLLVRDLEFNNEPNGGSNLRLPTRIGISEAGLYWVDVILDGKMMTRIPHMVLVNREKAEIAATSPAKKKKASKKK